MLEQIVEMKRDQILSEYLIYLKLFFLFEDRIYMDDDIN